MPEMWHAECSRGFHLLRMWRAAAGNGSAAASTAAGRRRAAVGGQRAAPGQTGGLEANDDGSGTASSRLFRSSSSRSSFTDGSTRQGRR
jgi:hypothetical protein